MNDLTSRLDLLCKRYPNTLGSSISKRERNHHYLMSHRPDTYGRFEDQFGVFFDLINKILLGINYIKKTGWPKYRSLQFLLIQNNLISLRNSVELAMDGYYSDSLALARINLEAVVRCVWMSCHPDNYDSALIKIKGKKEFNYSNFVLSDLNLEWKDYSFWSPAIHANQMAVVKDWTEILTHKKVYPICLELKFDKLMMEVCINSIIFLELFNLKIVTEILVTDLDNRYLTSKLINDAKEFISCYESMIMSHKKEYWPKIPKDISDLIKLIKKMDEIPTLDFKIELDKIRAVA